MYYMKALLLFLMLPLLIAKPGINTVKLLALDGEYDHIATGKNIAATIILFVSPECPLCQGYSLNIKNMAGRYQKNGFRFIAVVPGKTYSALQVSTFKGKYHLTDIAFYFDPKLELAHLLKASVTPEVFVLDKTGELVYSGRIDNWVYELGKKRTVVTEHDLENVLSAIANHKKMAYHKTKAMGCFIE